MTELGLVASRARPLLVRRNPQLFRHPDEVRQRARLHFLDCPGTVQLDGRFAGPQRASDLFIGKAPNHQPHYFPLSRAQPFVALPQLRYLGPLLSRPPVLIDGLLDRIQKVLVAERLGEKLHRAGFDSPNRHGNIAVAGDEDNWDMEVALGELVLQLESADPGEPDIQHQAAGSSVARAGKKLLGRTERLDAQTHRPQQASHRLAHGRIVVYHEDGGVAILVEGTAD